MTDEATTQTDTTPSRGRPTAWTPEAILGVHNVNQVRVSPDGARVVYVVSDAVMGDEKSEFVTQIYLAHADGSGERQITFGPTSSTNPDWSPDGRWIAFTAKRDTGDKAKASLYRLPADGPGEAEPLLKDLKSDVGAFRWSPDGAQIAFVMTDPPTEDEEKRGKDKEDWRWAEEDIKYGRLYVVDAEKGPDGKRPEPRKLTTADVHVSGPGDWSPDGRSIVFAHARSPKADHWPTSTVSRVDVATGEVTPLVGGNGRAAMQPLYSPDGSQIAFTLTEDPPRWAFYGAIHLISASASRGDTPREMPATFDGQPALVGWSADGAKLYFAERNGTLVRLAAMDVATGDISGVGDGAAPDGGSCLYSEFTLNAPRTHLGFRLESSDRAVEAHISRCDDFTPVPVSQANAVVADRPVGKTEVVRWKSPDGTEIEGLLTYPVGHEAGRPFPLLLVIHGGPAGVFLQSFLGAGSIYPLAAFTEKGFALLRPNPRGSSGYGKAFRYANLRDWGGGDYEDLMAGVDKLIADGIADPARLGVLGWSYGGFMTSWVVTHTGRFKAASIGAAVTNLVSFTGTADIPGFVPDYFGGQPWDSVEAAAVYQAHSPMSHAAGVTTPCLIQHGESDDRVPISQGYELFNALRQRGVETRLLVLPRQPHGPTEPKMQLKTMQTNLEWFERLV